MRTISVVQLSPGDQITHDGTNELRKALPVRSVANSQVRVPSPKEGRPLLSQNESHIIVNDTMVFHKTWRVTVK